ncbi:MAG TPA: beta-galactosidase [Candidatus Eisenbacteria bacterium]|nr:beta-galactosidase [Candidatus Eisenbacteria bacterium]
MRRWKRRKSGPVALAVFAAAAIIALAVGVVLPPVSQVEFGATFSKPYAEELGLDWRETYLAVLDDLGVRKLRIPAYWNEIEPVDGEYHFDDLDWQIDEAAKRGATVILSVGLRAPRWPECYAPAWAGGLGQDELDRRVLTMIETVVRRYAAEPAIVAWQVENEPFYRFGDCPRKIPVPVVASEIALVHSLDGRPVLLQDIGEFSLWLRSARMSDVLGVSMYRDVWNRYLGYVRWPGVAGWYRLRASLAHRYVGKVIITEMQAEPWTTTPVTEVPIDEQLRRMNPKELAANIAFARRIGFPETYVWGVEWWYWLKTKGHPEVWEEARKIFTLEP